MKAISIRPDYALQIFFGEKTKEFRSWNTKHRGDLLICSTARKIPGTISGHALCVVNLKDIVQLSGGTYAWMLDDLRVIKPFKVKGQQRLYNVNDDLIQYPTKNDLETDHGEEYVTQDFMDRYFEPLAN